MKKPKKAGPRVAIVSADFHEAIAAAMLASANSEAQTFGARVVETVHVSGCYETPLMTERLLGQKGIDAVIVLGCIERGETLHGEVMGHVVHRALLESSLQYDKPVGLGIIGPGATPAQATARTDGTARSAVRAAMRSLAVSASAKAPRSSKGSKK
ncbi:MAG TPA: 6,7-dimethyl-8-ribityllumazine synthase [Polyangiaceae bacterium]|nr:6,7-dimethyl-8-ribityllumazine synthase [Polyangiaceae bacterium]